MVVALPSHLMMTWMWPQTSLPFARAAILEGNQLLQKQVGNKRRKLLTLRASPPAHPETTPRRVEAPREVWEQRGGQLS
eukprot:7433154-Pyramimonas_sp.AAC.1